MSLESAALVTLVLLVASLTDLRDRLVPNRLTLGAGLCGLVLAAVEGLPVLATAALAATALSLPLLLVSLARPDGLGMGDVKLVAVLGICLGWQAVPALFAGLLLAGMAGLLLCLGSRRLPSEVALPLVPFLALGTLPLVISAVLSLQ